MGHFLRNLALLLLEAADADLDAEVVEAAVVLLVNKKQHIFLTFSYNTGVLIVKKL